MNINKTRIIVYESIVPVFPDVIKSINKNVFEIVAVVDDGGGVKDDSYPVISFEDIADTSFWDLFIINDKMLVEQIMKIFQLLKIPPERYFFISNHIDDIRFYQYLFVPGTPCGKHIDFAYSKAGQNYMAISVGGADYLTNSKDDCISRHMFMKRENFALDDIEFFINLTEEYYGTPRDTGGYFMDIGANIGTTCVYVKKNLCPNIKIIGFEPIKENFKLLRINTILNDINDAYLVNAAVSDSCSSRDMVVNEFNFGGCAILESREEYDATDLPKETVDSVTVESFLSENNIRAEDVKYVWIDTEGFETDVLQAAGPLLKSEGTAVFMEYSPVYASPEKIKKLSDICVDYYKYFICADDYTKGDKSPRPISELYDLGERYPNQTNVFLIKDCS